MEHSDWLINNYNIRNNRVPQLTKNLNNRVPQLTKNLNKVRDRPLIWAGSSRFWSVAVIRNRLC